MTALAFFGLLGVTAAHTLIETARDALFLARVPATHLPALYLAIAVAGVITSRASALFAQARPSAPAAGSAREDARRTIDPVALSMGGAAAITTAFWFVAATPSRVVLYALYVFSGMFAAWVAGQLWLRLGTIFTVVQAKRLYGAVGTGAVLGAVLGSAIARAILAVIEVRHLLLVAAAVLLVTAIGPASLLPPPKPRPRKATARETEARLSFRSEIGSVLGHPYLVRLLALSLFAAFVGTAIDFLFKRQVALWYAPQAIGPFLATVYLATNAASLLAQAIGVGVAVRWLGVQRALYIMPFLLLLGAGGVVLGIGIAVLALRGLDGAFRHSLHKTSTELLFVPLPDSLRTRAKPIIELLGQRGGQAFASVVILGLATLLPEHAGVTVGGAVIVLCLGWLALARAIRPRYLDVFRETLRRGRAELSGDLPALDMGALEALIAALSSRRDAEVLGALDLLAAQQRGRLIPSLILFHPSKPIVLRALELFVRGRTDFVAAADRLLDHPDAEVRAAALRAHAAAEPDPDFLREHLRAPFEELRATALVTLLFLGEISGDEAKGALDEVLQGSVEGRRAFARALGEVPAPPKGDRALVERALLTLAKDDDTETRALAATAMGVIGLPSFAPVLVRRLRDRSAAGLAAAAALGAMGDASIDLLDRTLDVTDEPPETKWRVVGALASSTSDRAIGILIERLKTTADTALRSRLLRALRAKQSIGQAVVIPAADLALLAEGTITAVARALSLRLAHSRFLSAQESERLDSTLGQSAGATLIQRLLRDKEIEGVDRLFLVLALLHPDERFPRIQRGLESSDPKERASARELLENVVRPPLRDAVIAVVDDISDDERLRRIGQARDEGRYDELIRAMIEQGGELGALAAYHANEAGIAPSMQDAIGKMDPSGAALARELSVTDLAKAANDAMEVTA